MPVAEIQIGGNSFKKTQYCLGKSCFLTKNTKFRRKIRISVNSAKKTHVFRKGVSFLRILQKRRTFPERGCHFCEFCEKGVRFRRCRIYIFS